MASVPKWEWPTWSLAHGRKIYMPGEEGASLEQLAYGMVEKLARQTTSLDQVKIWTK